VALLSDRQVADQIQIPADAEAPELVRCLRCGTWISPTDVAVTESVGTAQQGASLSEVPLPARGSYGRKVGVLKLLALDRLLRGLALLAAAVGAATLSADRSSVLGWLKPVIEAAEPLGQQLGVHLTDSAIVTRVETILEGDGRSLELAGVVLLGYGLLLLTEGVGLWGGWRWAEYLAAVEIMLLLPFSLDSVVSRPTALAVAAVTINIAAVAYLVFKGRLFGIRGGHEGYLAAVRRSTLLADILAQFDRSPSELSSDRVI
jgi:uncharacterized membrane protein (DUF2068 family)